MLPGEEIGIVMVGWQGGTQIEVSQSAQKQWLQ